MPSGSVSSTYLRGRRFFSQMRRKSLELARAVVIDRVYESKLTRSRQVAEVAIIRLLPISLWAVSGAQVDFQGRESLVRVYKGGYQNYCCFQGGIFLAFLTSSSLTGRSYRNYRICRQRYK